MPRRSVKKSTAAPVAEITEAEVMALWQEAGGNALADATAAGTMAEAFNALIGHRSLGGRTRPPLCQSMLMQSGAALRALESLEAEIVAAANAGATAEELVGLPPLTCPLADRLRDDLPRLLAILAPAAANRPPWADCAAAAWHVAVAAGAPPSAARTALAVKFAALATARLGFGVVTPTAVSLFLRRRSQIPREIECV